MLFGLRKSAFCPVKIISLLLLIGTIFSCGREEEKKENVNVLLISIDTLRPDHLGCYGYGRNTSPNIDALAGRGAVFENTVSTTSWTLPAHISLLSGTDVSVHGVKNDGLSLHRSIPMLAEIFQEKGYSTAAFCSSPYLNPAFGFDRGFDVYHNTDLEKDGFSDTIFLEDRDQWQEVHEDVTSPRIERLAVDWLEKHHDERFFLFLHFWDPHFDFIPPPPYDTLFDPDYQGTVTSRHFMFNEDIYEGMDPRDLAHIVALYDGEIAFTDFHLGRIIDRMGELGLLDRTLIVITGDHGEEFFEHGNKGHRITLYDESVKVPLIIVIPGRDRGGMRIVQQAGIIDIAVTILDYLGLPAGLPMHGRSLLPLLEGKKPDDENPQLVELEDTLRALRTNRYKLLFNVDHRETTILDLEKDPRETHDHLVTSLDGWTEANREFYRRLEADRILEEKYRRGQTGQAVKLSEEQIERLKALGYIK
ncbi:MAG: sulfatase [PVC group bacterium]